MSITREVHARLRLPSPAMAREIRRAAGVSQMRLAHELGVTGVTVGRWESGSRSPRGDLLVAYVDLLDELATATGRPSRERVSA